MTNLLEQYNAVRDEMGFINRSGVGKIAISGADRYSWLQGMVSNDVYQLSLQGVGWCQACVLDATGHVLSDMTLMNVNGAKHTILAQNLGLTDQAFVLIDLPRNNVPKLIDLFDRYIIMEDVEVRDVSGMLDCFSLQGPTAGRAWNECLIPEIGEASGNRYIERLIPIPADHTGSGGFDVYCPQSLADEICSKILRKDETEIGFEVQEILRVEAGIPQYGVDMDQSTLAPEAGLMPTHVSLTKGCYVGQEVIARIDSRGHTNRALTGLLFPPGSAPAPGDKIYAPAEVGEEGREVGWITSALAISPAMNGRPIALGYVRHEQREPGSTLRIGSEGRIGIVTELPFYRRPGS